MWASVRDRVIRLLESRGLFCTRVSGSLYRLQNGSLVWIKYSDVRRRSGRSLRYWFGIPKDEFCSHPPADLFVLFVCGSEDHVLVVPATILTELFRSVDTAVDGAWKLDIYKEQEAFVILVTGKPRRDISAYLGRYELLWEEGNQAKGEGEEVVTEPPGPGPEQDSIESKILGLDGVEGTTVHDRLADMVVQVGKWMGYESVRGHQVREDAPYRVDVAWLRYGAVHIAVEVQIGGDPTKARERLVLAKRFGARKCIAVADPDTANALLELFRLEGEVRHWVEIWGPGRIYDMFVSGRTFFRDCREFDRHQYRDDVPKIM